VGVGLVLGLLDSSVVTLAVVFGIPLAIGLVVALGFRRKTPPLVLLAGSLLVCGIAILAAWAIFQPAGGTAEGSTASPPTSSPASSPGASPGSSPTISPGAGGSGSSVSYECSPSGTQLQETAKGITFEKDCLAAPADQAFSIEFQNQDPGTPHNIHIFSADPSEDPNARSLFTGDLVTGPSSMRYEVQALPGGRYFFHCDVHPTQMVGGFVVGEV
jgi:plastocyanin